MPKKETTGKGLAGGELTKKEQAAVNASATSQDETPKKEKKKAEKKKAEKKKAEKKNRRSDRRPVHHSCHATRGCWPIQDGDDAKAPAPNMSGLDASMRDNPHTWHSPSSALPSGLHHNLHLLAQIGRGLLRRDHPPRSPNSGSATASSTASPTWRRRSLTPNSTTPTANRSSVPLPPGPSSKRSPARNKLWNQYTRRSGRTGDEHLVKSKEDLDDDQNDDVPLDAQAAAGL